MINKKINFKSISIDENYKASKEDMKYFKQITSQEYIKGHKNIVIMGYNTWNIYFEHDLNSIYQSEVKFSNGKYPHLQTIKLGLIFYIL